MTWDNWLSSIASLISSIGIIFLLLQFRLSNKQFKSDHDRTRRLKTIEIMMEFEKSSEPEISAADRLITSLSIEQCRKIITNQPVSLDKEKRPLVEACLDEYLTRGIQENSNTIVLDVKIITRIRHLIVSYLNMLEIVCVSWQQAIVDRDIIEYQFQFLYRPKEGYKAQEDFRESIGGCKVYPAIEQFLEKLIENYNGSKKIIKPPL